MKSTRRNPVIFVIGATGSGKSAAAISLAASLAAPPLSLHPHVVNCDVMQMYRGLPIATNKTPPEERAGVPHHMMDFLDPSAAMTAVEFTRRASQLIDEVSAADPSAVFLVCGGTHYYAQALMVANSVIEDGEVETGWTDELSIGCADAPSLWGELHAIDPESAKLLHPNDTRRIERRLQIARQSGIAPSEVAAQQRAAECLRFGADRTLVVEVRSENREAHNRRLDSRVDLMVSQGLLSEVRELFSKVLRDQSELAHVGAIADQTKRARLECNAAQSPPVARRLLVSGLCSAIGFKEFVPAVAEVLHVSSDTSAAGCCHPAIESCIDAVKSNTRRYARQQEQWIRNRLRPAAQRALGDGDVLLWLQLTPDSPGAEPRAAVDALCRRAAAWLSNRDAAGDSTDVCPGLAVTQLTRAEVDKVASDSLRRALRVCELCDNKTLCGDEQYEAHLASRQHRSALKRRALEERMAAEGRTLPPRRNKVPRDPGPPPS